MAKFILNKEGLTDMEVKVMESALKSEYNNGETNPTFISPWNFSVQDHSGLDGKQYRGVCSSLIKKGLIAIEDQEGRGKANDMVFVFTLRGLHLFTEEVEVKTTDQMIEDELQNLPEEFRGTVSYMAYERGHSAGKEEVLNILRDLISDLKPAIEKFEARVRQDKKTWEEGNRS